MKIVISGSSQSGKSTLIKTLDPKCISVDEQTVTHETTTVAMDVGKYQINNYTFTIFGTPGLDRFSVIRSILTKGTDVLLFLFDGENASHDENALNVLKEITTAIDSKNPRFYIIFAVNKIDLPDCRSSQQIYDLIQSSFSEEELNAIKAVTIMKDSDLIKIFEISAKENQNLEELMQAVLILAIQKWKPVLQKIDSSDKTKEDLSRIFNLEFPKLKDLLNELEMRKLVVVNRSNGSVEISPHGNELLEQ